MTTTQRARAAINSHNVGKRYAFAISDTFVNLLVEAGESRWPALLDERLALLDGAAHTTSRVTRPLAETTDEPRTDIHGRMRAAIEGRSYVDLTNARPTARELREADEREQRIRERDEPVTVPATAHVTLREALTGETAGTVPADAHDKMRRAFTGGR